MHMHDPHPFSYEVEEANFDERVIARSQEEPILLDIGAEWCAPCNVLGPRLADAGETAGEGRAAGADKARAAVVGAAALVLGDAAQDDGDVLGVDLLHGRG